ncbi:arabinofuranosyltransferase [Nocardia tengchongensis]|uniref:Galactan 5-O-arabinofuranosyltransferase n=1 Tax=Nocardia tengchongensis TaxID=2055889 RepID=A0ABX8CLV1_9NOCA|nr:arabinofuranosyltransferase [Nocardia tengchongensis]
MALVGLLAMGRVHWPAYTTSHVLRTLITVGQVSALAVIVVAFALTRRSLGLQVGSQRARWTSSVAKALSWTGISGFAAATLGVPLAASRLYLSGLSPDQEQRVTLLGRFAASPAWRDAIDVGLPPDQAVGWYWLGGRVAAVTGTPAWQAFSVYAIVSLAVAAVLALVWWSRLLRADLAILVATGTTAVAVAYGATDPAFTLCVLVLAPAVVAFATALGRGEKASTASSFVQVAATPRHAWARLGAVGVVAVLCAAVDGAALVLAAAALTVVAVVAGLGSNRRVEVAFRWGVVMLLAVAAAALVWGSYLSRRGPSGLGELTITAEDWSTTWRVVAAAAAVVAAALMARFALAKARTPDAFGRLLAVGAVLVAVAFAQHIPDMLAVPIATAYSDTDGGGRRADGFPASAIAVFPDLEQVISAQTGRPANETVLLTGDTTLLAVYPYSGYLAQSARYSNPLSNHDARVRAVRDWSGLATADTLAAALDRSVPAAPDVFVLRRNKSGDLVLRVAQDIHDDNGVTRTYESIVFAARLFDGPRFARTNVGAFTVVVRSK